MDKIRNETNRERFCIVLVVCKIEVRWVSLPEWKMTLLWKLFGKEFKKQRTNSSTEDKEWKIMERIFQSRATIDA